MRRQSILKSVAAISCYGNGPNSRAYVVDSLAGRAWRVTANVRRELTSDSLPQGRPEPQLLAELTAVNSVHDRL